MNKIQFPKEIMIEATNHCNNKCFFCASPVSDRPRGYIEPTLAYRLIDEAYNLGCRKISFHGMGEPFLCKELSKFVDRAKKTGYEYIYMDSNGTLAGEGVVEPVLDAGLDSLKFSIHAATAETFKKITNNDAFDKVFENVKYISKYIKEHELKCKTIAYFALSKINEDEADMFKELFGKYFSDVWIRPIHNGSGMRPENEKYAVKEDEFATMNGLPCHELYERIIINWEGRAIACSTDWTGDLIYGDTNVASLESVWNNEKIYHLRDLHKKADTLPRICASCMGYARKETSYEKSILN